MNPDIVRCTSELHVAHDSIQSALSGAWDAAITLLREPDDIERHQQCSVVATFVRDVHLHIRQEDDVVLATAERAGVSLRAIEDLRAEHHALRQAMATLPPLLDDRHTIETAALRVLRLVARFEHHLAREESVIATFVTTARS